MKTETTLQDHRHFIKKVIFILLLLVIPLAFIFTALFIGRYSVSVSEVFRSLASPFAGGAGISPQTLTVVLARDYPPAVLLFRGFSAIHSSTQAFWVLIPAPASEQVLPFFSLAQALPPTALPLLSAF